MNNSEILLEDAYTQASKRQSHFQHEHKKHE